MALTTFNCLQAGSRRSLLSHLAACHQIMTLMEAGNKASLMLAGRFRTSCSWPTAYPRLLARGRGFLLKMQKRSSSKRGISYSIGPVGFGVTGLRAGIGQASVLSSPDPA